MIDTDRLGTRIAIIGPSNSGKSTLADALGRRLDLSVVHLDQLAFAPGTNWERVSNENLFEKHDEAIRGERWVIEGNYSICMPERLARAHSLLWLDPPLAGCIWRYILRSLKTRHERVGGLKDAPHEFNISLVKYTLVNYPKNRIRYREIIARYAHLARYDLKSFAEVKTFNRMLVQ